MNRRKTLPGGDLMAVGGTEGLSTAGEPAAFRRVKGTWKSMDLSKLGDNVTGLSSCAGTGDAVLLQGTAGGQDAVWSSTDGTTFARVEVGNSSDDLGTIETVEGGFVATGRVDQGNESRPVLWLSPDGEKWHSLDIPADRQLYAVDMVATPESVVVAMLGASGPAVAVLDNADELLD